MSREKWKQLPAEDAPQFAAFCAYRDSDPNTRSIRTVCEQYHGEDFTENDYKRWLRYATKHRWKERSRAWDEYKDDVSRETELAAIRQMRRDQVQAAKRIQQVGEKSILRELEKFEKDPEYQLNPALILQFLTQGASMERQVRGEPATVHGDENGEQTLKIEWGAPIAKRSTSEEDGDPAPNAASRADGDHSE